MNKRASNITTRRRSPRNGFLTLPIVRLNEDERALVAALRSDLKKERSDSDKHDIEVNLVAPDALPALSSGQIDFVAKCAIDLLYPQGAIGPRIADRTRNYLARTMDRSAFQDMQSALLHGIDGRPRTTAEFRSIMPKTFRLLDKWDEKAANGRKVALTRVSLRTV